MNILILNDSFPPLSNAGAENISYMMAKEYYKMGHVVTVVTINKKLPKNKIAEYNEGGIRVIQIGARYDERFVAYISLYNFAVLRMIKKILEASFDFAHLHNIHRYISYGVIGLLKKHAIKTILTVHDAMSVDYGKFTQGINKSDLSPNPQVTYEISAYKTFLEYGKRYNPFRNIIIRYYFRQLDKIIVVSKELELFLNKNRINNTTVIHNGIDQFTDNISSSDLENFRQSHHILEKDKLVLWAGRLSEGKGASQVKKILSQLIKKDKNIKLIISGNDTFNDEVLKDNIISTGWLNKKEMSMVYKVSMVTIVPSIYPDPLPTIILESMREGLPVVGTCFGGAKEMISTQTGFVVNPFNVDEFSKAILHILNNNDLKDNLSVESKKRFVKYFTIDVSAKKYLELVSTL